MSDTAETPVLERLDHFQADLDAARLRDEDLLSRLGWLEIRLARIRREETER